MKRSQYILFSALLSFLIVYLEVGIPIIRVRCVECIDVRSQGALLAGIEVAEGGCTCGCAERKTGCCCASQSAGCVSNATGDASQPVDDASQPVDDALQTSGNGCSQVRIEKLNLPTLVSPIHLDNVQLPIVELLFNSFYTPIDLFASGQGQRHRTDWRMHEPPPRGYLNLICTLLI